jgi:hypothetical protein
MVAKRQMEGGMKRQKDPSSQEKAALGFFPRQDFGLAEDKVGPQDVGAGGFCRKVLLTCQNLQLEESPGFFS